MMRKKKVLWLLPATAGIAVAAGIAAAAGLPDSSSSSHPARAKAVAPVAGHTSAQPAKHRNTVRSTPTGAADGTVVVHTSPASPSSTSSYWTKEQMANANPAPMTRSGGQATSPAPKRGSTAPGTNAKARSLKSASGSPGSGPAVSAPASGDDPASYWTKDQMNSAQPDPGAVRTGHSPQPPSSAPAPGNTGGGTSP